MPADIRHAAPSRRTFQKLTPEDEIGIKRARGQISCAECRRLKLKCDRALPCGSCVRRGCSNICPNGIVTSSQSTRFALADIEKLHRKISEMGQRIQQLEEALAIFQSAVSSQTHPLLRDELLAVKFGPELRKPYESRHPQDALAESMKALGTLRIGDSGESTYFGNSAGSETLLLAGAELGAVDIELDTGLSTPEPLSLESTFPFGLGCAPNGDKFDTAMSALFACLPPSTRAWTLCETYMEQGAWLFRPMKRDEIIDDIITPIYNAKKQWDDPNCEVHTAISPHKLAVLFMIFALGALVDLTLPPCNDEGDSYCQYGRTALSLRSIFESPVIETVQAVVLMALYRSNAGKRYTRDSVWTLLSLGAKLAQTIGLHRDPARWNMDEKTVERRRGLFWEVFTLDLLLSAALGRPPAIRLSYIDCAFPTDQSDPDFQYWKWKYQFTKDVFASVIELTLAATPPSYETILELDRKAREKPLPQALSVFMANECTTPSICMQFNVLSQFRSVTMLYIHRSFFAQALLDHPANPLRSAYAPSFLAAYRCASLIIKSSGLNNSKAYQELCMRWWTVWTHVFSAAIIVGSIATRAPSSSMASAARAELDLAVDFFERGANFSHHARNGLIILSKLKEKAALVLAQFRSGGISPVTATQIFYNPEDGTDELAIFGGQARVMVSKLLSATLPACGGEKQPETGLLSEPMSLASFSSGLSTVTSDAVPKFPPCQEDRGMQDVHPSLLEYMSLFPPSGHSPGVNNSQDQNTNSYFEDRSFSNGVPAFPPFNSRTESSNFSYAQTPLTCSIPTRQPQEQLAGTSSQQKGFGYDPMSFYGYHPPHTGATSRSASTPEMMRSGDLMADLGVMMNGDSGMDGQWMSFMRDSGIVHSYPGNAAP